MTPHQIARLFSNEVLVPAKERLLELSESVYQQPIAPGKWSPIQIIGHLIDSAANNHHRFVKAQFVDHLAFDGYAQEDWVNIQNYQNGDWSSLIELWYWYNQHIGHLIQNIAEKTWNQPRTHHHLDRIAWKTQPQNEAVTLGYFVIDYIGHLEHHLKQVFSDYEPVIVNN